MPSPATLDALTDQLKELQQQGLLTPAIDHWKQDVANAERLQLISIWLNKRGLEFFHADAFGDALDSFNLALRAHGDNVAALNNAAACLKEIGRLDKSTAHYQRAMALQPSFTEAHSGYLMNLHYTPGMTPDKLAAVHREWDAKHTSGLKKPSSYLSSREPERALNIGIVSADLGQHPVGFLLVRYLENIDRSQYRITGYIDGRREGGLASRINKALVHCHDVHELDDEALAKKIHSDGIDILIDLSGHTAGNRLGVFARKPAPIQVAWLGYPGDTGLSAMDYVIADRLIYPESFQPFSQARIKYLPDSFVCFDPPLDAPPVNTLPTKMPGQITFGCMHNPAKCNDEMIVLWAEILTRLPQSHLAFKYKGFGDASCQDDFKKRFADKGIKSERLSFEGASDFTGLFAFMQGIDLALDPLPFAGGLMTCLTLWMGVPVLTMPGALFAGRQGLSFLSTIGITDTIAESREDYIAKAITLANDLPRLQSLRQRLRPAMEASPLCDGKRATKGLQDLLRDVWKDYCKK